MKDYYAILDIAPEAGSEEIRRAYRRLALRYHPDRNPGDPAAERFKEIAEAYAVLSDAGKRAAYDRARRQGGTGQGSSGFNHSQEAILRDLFADPLFGRMMEGLMQEFSRAGLRADRRFFKQTFCGGRGIWLAGFFLWGAFNGSGRSGGRVTASPSFSP